MTIKTIAAIFTTTLITTPAFAHASEHADVSTANLAQHIMNSPFHLAGLVAVVFIAGGIARRIKKAKR